jgi:hypothetical protein
MPVLMKATRSTAIAIDFSAAGFNASQPWITRDSPWFFAQEQLLYQQKRELNAVLERCYELIKDKDAFAEVVASLREKLALQYQQRLSKWINFFNSNCTLCKGYFDEIFFALADLVLSNELFRAQSAPALAISFRFWETLFERAPLFYSDDVELLMNLMQISLCAGLYPGMVCRSFYKGFQLINREGSAESLQALFNFLFVKYENPAFFTSRYGILQLEELDFLMFVLQGNSARLFEGLPLVLSRKEAHHLLHILSADLPGNDNLLLRATVCAKFSARCDDYAALCSFFERSRSFEIDVVAFVRDFDFWLKAFLLIQHDIANMSYTLDFLEEVKRTSNPPYTLLGRTRASLRRDADHWHHALHLSANLEYRSLKWKEAYGPSNVFSNNNKNYKVLQLLSGEELYSEGRALRHCVSSYAMYCAQGQGYVFSFRLESGAVFRPLLTIQVSKSLQVVQVSGMCNRPASPSELLLLKAWASEMNFEF